MIIKKIIIENFACFYGNHEFNISENVTLFNARNGDGKTTISRAFAWVFKEHSNPSKAISMKKYSELSNGESTQIRVKVYFYHHGEKAIEKYLTFTKEESKFSYNEERLGYKIIEGLEISVPVESLLDFFTIDLYLCFFQTREANVNLSEDILLHFTRKYKLINNELSLIEKCSNKYLQMLKSNSDSYKIRIKNEDALIRIYLSESENNHISLHNLDYNFISIISYSIILGFREYCEYLIGEKYPLFIDSPCMDMNDKYIERLFELLDNSKQQNIVATSYYLNEWGDINNIIFPKKCYAYYLQKSNDFISKGQEHNVSIVSEKIL